MLYKMVVNGEKEEETKKETSATFVIPPSPVLQVLQKCNSFFMQGLIGIQGDCRPLFACGKQVGIIRPDVAYILMDYPTVFTATQEAFHLNPKAIQTPYLIREPIRILKNRFQFEKRLYSKYLLEKTSAPRGDHQCLYNAQSDSIPPETHFSAFALNTYKSRTEALDVVLRDMRAKTGLLALRGWRDECFNVWSDFGGEPLFKIERSAVTVFGIRAFGVHITGYTRRSDGRMAVWVQKRAASKPTWPGMLDSMVGGGIEAGMTPSQVVVKEAAEEASIPEDIIRSVVPAGAVSFFTETERGLHANTEFVYDLELPTTFVPKNSDGEVEGFELIPVEEFLSRVLSSKYKLTSAPIALDFLLRRGFINTDNEHNIPAIQELLHVPLHQFYRHWPLNYVHSPPPSPISFDTPNTEIDRSLCFEA